MKKRFSGPTYFVMNGRPSMIAYFALREKREAYQDESHDANECSDGQFAPLNSVGSDRHERNCFRATRNKEFNAVEHEVSANSKRSYPQKRADDDDDVLQHSPFSPKFHRHSKHITRTARWKALRLQALRRDGFQCVQCGARGRLEVDHIAPVRNAPDQAFNLDNLQALCAPCHSRKTRIECGFPPPNPERQKWLNAVKALCTLTNER